MSSKVTKIVAGIAACIACIAVVFYIINGIDALTELAEYEGDYITAAKGLSIFQLVMAIIILLSGVATAIMGFAPSVSKKNTISALIGVGVLTACEKLASIIGSIIIVKKYLFPDATLSGTSITTIIFVVLALLFLVGALFMIRFKKSIQGAALGSMGSLWLVVVFIISISSGTDSNGFTILYLVFILIAMLMMIITFAMSGVKEPHKVVYAGHESVIEEKPTHDSAEELLKLKKLLDAGAITQEEYEEKRKKYVDCL